MSSLMYKDRVYSGTNPITSTGKVFGDNGSGTSVTTQQMLMNILGDMATVESSVASKAYSIGDYIVLDSYFYKVTAAIAQGDTFVEGTNIEKTNVGAEVSQLNSNTLGTEVSLNSYTSTFYTFPEDGYVTASTTASQSAKSICRIYGATSNSPNFLIGATDGTGFNDYATYTCFVKKGMRCKVEVNAQGSVKYYPLI